MMLAPLAMPTKEATAASRRTVVLTGSGRTGTSVLGRLVSSFKGFEYLYEPATLLALTVTSGAMPIDVFKVIWSYAVVDDGLLGALAGRSLNLNPHDESSARGYLTDAEIDRRLSASARYRDLISQLEHHRVLVKLPDVSGHLSTTCAAFPDVKVVATGREPGATINSIVERGWFDHLEVGSFGHTLPSRIVEDRAIPFWVDDADLNPFVTGDGLIRAGLYYATMVRAAARLPGAVLVDYDDLVVDPEATCSRLLETLQAQPGDRTADVVASLRPSRPIDQPLCEALPAELLDRVMDAWAEWKNAGRSTA